GRVRRGLLQQIGEILAGGLLRGHQDALPTDGLGVVPVAALGIALVAVGAVAGRAPTVPDPPDGRTLVQYGYTTVLPTGWEHTGGLPDRRRSLLTRTGSPDGAELIAVERTPLGYDSSVEPERARAELAAEFRRRAAAQDLRDYRGDTVAGRPVLRYRQAGPGASVDWFVLFAGTDELVVGCRYPDAPAVTAACAAVVASVRPAG
ncbi:MAG: type VII secretion-associated protein, partial [Pseudonocardia sp.]|nr:type VII secretion-associated protein [Pseudonocardia sp.]